MTAVLVDAPATPVDEALRRLRPLVSPWTGIVHAVYELLPSADEPPLFRIGSKLADGVDTVGVPLGHLDGTGGASASRDAALAAAIGEAVERYAGSFVPEGEHVLATARELGAEAVVPESFALFHPRQHATPGFPFVPFTSDTRVRWTRGFRLLSGEPVWLPAQLVHLVERGGLHGEPAIGYATSNGLACAPTLEEALLAGLLELVERDAFMIAWAGRVSLPHLDWTENAGLLAFERERLAPTGLSWSCVDLSGFLGVPVVLSLVRDRRSGLGALGVGAAAAADAAAAVPRALAEAFSVRAWARELCLADRTDAAPDYSDINDFGDHIRFYADARRAGLAGFLDASPSRRRVADVPRIPGERPLQLLTGVVDRLEAERVDVYAVDVSPVDIRSAGLSVVRVVAPQLCALDAVHDARYLGGRRLYRAAFDAGLAAAPLGFDDVNPLPHPFP